MTASNQPQTEVKVFHQFCSNLPSSKYIFKSGKTANFVGGKYLTTIPSEIEELENEITLGHPHIFVDKNEKTVDSDAADPLAKLRKKIIEEYVAAQTAAVDPANDMGNSVKTTTGVMVAGASAVNVATSNTKK